MNQKLIPNVFNSPTYGQMEWDEILVRMARFIASDTQGNYEVIIGTDSEASLASRSSQSQGKDADFVSAIIVHKKGRGGVYFWGRQKFSNLHSMKQRIWQEAIVSLSIAQKLVEEVVPMGFLELNLEIHVDIGPNGETRMMINDIVGMIRANGFKVATKPSSWGASHVADRHV